MELTLFIKIGLPVSLGFIMLSMGLMLKLSDFKQVLRYPKAFLVGLSAQMLLVPLLALFLLQFFDLPPLLAVGLLVLSFSPGGTTSNLFSYLAKGDVALSIALTACASLITPFTLPFLTELALQFFMGENKDIVIPIGLTMKRLLIVTVVPVLIGMSIKLLKPVWAEAIQPVIHKLSILLFFTVIFSMIISQWEQMPRFLEQVGVITTLMIILAMLSGYVLAKSTGLTAKQVKTMTIEVGMQNGGMALIVTQGVLDNPTMSIVPVIYGLIMLVPISFYLFLVRNEASRAL
ncbi:MAG: bile acid:sodium symporter family protein [Cocleimonas sp.]|nr:bile acid:sodium symporter family protein [Cocleimonas sp.]